MNNIPYYSPVNSNNFNIVPSITQQGVPSPTISTSTISYVEVPNLPRLNIYEKNDLNINPATLVRDVSTPKTPLLIPITVNNVSDIVTTNWKIPNPNSVVTVHNNIKWTGFKNKIASPLVQGPIIYPTINLTYPSPAPLVTNIINPQLVLPLINTFDMENNQVAGVFKDVDISRVISTKAHRTKTAKQEKNTGAYSIKYIMSIATKLGIPINNNKESIVNSIHEYYRRYIENKGL